MYTAGDEGKNIYLTAASYLLEGALGDFIFDINTNNVIDGES